MARHLPIKDRVPISERPEVINNKERFGDWEIDTIIGKDHAHPKDSSEDS